MASEREGQDSVDSLKACCWRIGDQLGPKEIAGGPLGEGLGGLGRR